MKKTKVLVGMSGGVDSTMAAYLLKQDGYDVEGVYMILHKNDEYHKQNIQRAKKAADFVGMKLHILDAQKSFDESVFKPFIASYSKGETPNPCALCNRNLKFGEMVKFADAIGATHISSGHYIKCDGEFLYEADDDTKDQSYFLFYIEKSVLTRLIFPLASMKKSEVKALAASMLELESFATQRESSEICFVENSYTDILKEHMEVDLIGKVVDKDGNVVGEHKGYMHYTIGKRRGFSVKGAHDPHYVLNIDAATNTITVGKKEDLACHSVELDNLNLFMNQDEFSCKVKLRYRTKAVPCSVKIVKNRAYVTLLEPVFGVAIGQAGVFYEDSKLLGGGWISKASL